MRRLNLTSEFYLSIDITVLLSLESALPKQKLLDNHLKIVIVHTMNYFNGNGLKDIPDFELDQFQGLITKLFQCCQERIHYQCERFKLPDAEFRCLMLFGEERYLTPKGITLKMNVVKSRVSKIIDGLEKKSFIRRIKDPEDSRVNLLSLTQQGQEKLNEINKFLKEVYAEVLLQLQPNQRKLTLDSLDLLTKSMKSVKEMMV